MVRCRQDGHVYDLTKVTVVARYSDCSAWRCPGPCGRLVDDRRWKGLPDYDEVGQGGDDWMTEHLRMRGYS